MTPDAEQLDVDVGDGLHLHVTRSGFGPPLVVLHGFTGSSETWMPLRTALDDRHTIIAVDMPGHGHSSAPDDPARYALSRFSNDLARTLDMLGLERVALLGYSMGGRAALGFALAHPSRIAALVLESTLPGIADSAERAARVAADHDLADSIVRDGIAAFVDRWERLPLWASQATLPEDTRTRLRAQRLANRPDGLANSLRGAGAGANQAATDRLAEQCAPTLLIAGALDTKYVALGRLMVTAMPQAELAVVPGAGHAVHLEQPEAFAGLVARFLDGVPRPPSTPIHRYI